MPTKSMTLSFDSEISWHPLSENPDYCFLNIKSDTSFSNSKASDTHDSSYHLYLTYTKDAETFIASGQLKNLPPVLFEDSDYYLISKDILEHAQDSKMPYEEFTQHLKMFKPDYGLDQCFVFVEKTNLSVTTNLYCNLNGEPKYARMRFTLYPKKDWVQDKQLLNNPQQLNSRLQFNEFMKNLFNLQQEEQFFSVDDEKNDGIFETTEKNRLLKNHVFIGESLGDCEHHLFQNTYAYAYFHPQTEVLELAYVLAQKYASFAPQSEMNIPALTWYFATQIMKLEEKLNFEMFSEQDRSQFQKIILNYNLTEQLNTIYSDSDTKHDSVKSIKI